MPDNYPNVFHFIWIGKGIEDYINNIKCWRARHPRHIINLWTTVNDLKNSRIKTSLKAANIQIRYINQNQTLVNYHYIKQEINKRNSWSASDILRISILLDEPGYYFDINVTPHASLPRYSNKEKAMFTIDVKNTIKYNALVLNLKMMASASVNHPIFQLASRIIKNNLDFLYSEKKQAEQFYKLSSCSNLDKNYIFAVIVTGRAVASSIAEKYLTANYFLGGTNIFDFDEIRELMFPYRHLINIPLAKNINQQFDKYDEFSDIMNFQTNLFTDLEIENTSLVNRLEKFSGLKFFSKLDIRGYVNAMAKIENTDDEKLVNKIKNFDHSGKILLGKNRFFIISKVNSKKVATELQNFLVLNKY